jgi:uncharacterized protein
MTERQDLPTGDFSTWLQRTRASLLDDSGADVPCGECNACCRASYFIHVAPGETEARARIPAELLFPAPAPPEGHFLLGYDERGCCPMLKGGHCSVYEHRPQTCRVYDCRVFAAAGMDADRESITHQSRRWKFRYPTRDDRRQHAAVKAAARFLKDHPGCFPGGAVPLSLTQVVLMAIRVYEVFLKHVAEPGGSQRVASEPETIAAVIAAREKFEAGRVAPPDPFE